MPSYVKKPCIVEAVQWLGDPYQEITDDWLIEAVCTQKVKVEDERLRIETLEGTMYAEEGDYIVQGVAGEIYPCKPDIFKQTYSKLD